MNDKMNIKTSGFKCDRNAWKTVRLGEILKVCHGQNQHEIEVANGKYPILGTGGEIGRTNHFLCNEPSVLIGRKGTIDEPQYMETPFWTIDTLFYTHIADAYIPKYIYYLFCTIDWSRMNEASGVPSLSAKTIENLEVCVVERKQQEMIVAALSSIDTQISVTKNLLSKYKSIKKATVKMLMTPTAEWQEATLGDFYTVSSGLSKGAEFFGSGYPFLSFVTVFNNPIIPDRLDNLVESSAYERKQCSVRRGDIFLTRTSETLDELGMSSVALQDYPDATFNGFTKRLRPIEGIPLCPEFMAFYLRTENFRKSICQKASITTRASLNKDTIEKLVIAYPIPSVQHEIAKNLMTMDKQRMILVEELDKLKQLKQSMLQYFFGD